MIDSEKDGVFRGQSEVRRYLEKVAFQGEWQNPFWSKEDGAVRVNGLVRLMGMDIKAKILVNFDQNNRIEKVKMARDGWPSVRKLWG